MKERLQYLQNKIEKEIPISALMGMKIDHIDTGSICLSAPIAPNKNGKNTGFAGSLYSTMALSGWILVTNTILDLKLNADCVIHKGSIDYIHPVQSQIQVVCAAASIEKWEKFVTRLQERSHANILLTANICDQEKTLVQFTGKYVAWKL